MPIITAGNLNVSSLIVPDLYVQIVPPSQLTLNGVPSNLAAFVGTASFGPVNTPVNISSFVQYNQHFGQLNNRKYDMGTHVAIAIQQGANNLVCVRVTDGTDTNATAAVATNITFSGLYTGSYGNNIVVGLQNGSKANTWRAVVTVPGFAAEIFDNIGPTNTIVTTTNTALVTASATVPVLSSAGIVVGDVVSGTGIAGNPTVITVNSSTQVTLSAAQTITNGTTLTFTPSFNQVWVNLASAINNGITGVRGSSQWVTAVAGAGTTTPTVTNYTLAGGTDGVTTITASILVGNSGSPPTGMYALASSGFSLLDVCDADTSTVWTSIDGYANLESAYAIQVIPTGTSVAASITAKQTAGLDSYNSKLIRGWCYWADPVLGINRLVSPQGFAIGRLGNLSPQLTTLNKTLYGIVGTEVSGLITGNVLSTYAQGDLNSLVSNGIDVITNPGAGGLDIWTFRFGHNSSSNASIHGDNYTTLTNYIATTINAGMGQYLGQVINPQIFANVTATLVNYCQTLVGAGLIGTASGAIPYAVLCNTSNNQNYLIQQGILNATVQIAFLGIVEKFIVSVQDGTALSITSVQVSNSQ
jgi:hypothetical protein